VVFLSYLAVLWKVIAEGSIEVRTEALPVLAPAIWTIMFLAFVSLDAFTTLWFSVSRDDGSQMAGVRASIFDSPSSCGRYA